MLVAHRPCNWPHLRVTSWLMGSTHKCGCYSPRHTQTDIDLPTLRCWHLPCVQGVGQAAPCTSGGMGPSRPGIPECSCHLQQPCTYQTLPGWRAAPPQRWGPIAAAEASQGCLQPLCSGRTHLQNVRLAGRRDLLGLCSATSARHSPRSHSIHPALNWAVLERSHRCH